MKQFKKLLLPIKPTHFFNDYWRKNILHISRDSRTHNLVTIDEINIYMGKEAITYPFLRMVGNGSEIDQSQYVLDPEGQFNLINKDSLYRLFEKGNTIVIQGSQYQFPKLNKYILELEKELNMSVNANIYITPSNAQGFYPHFDTHEVFVLQISGSKKWNIYDMPIPSPIKGMGLTKDQRDKYLMNNPLHNLKLEEGDLLYIPRGVVHDAYSENELSIHITFGLMPLLRNEVAKRLVNSLENQEFFREPFAENIAAATSDEKDKFKQEMSRRLDDILDQDFMYTDYRIKFNKSVDLFNTFFVIDNLGQYKSEIQFKCFDSVHSETNKFTDDEKSLFIRITNNQILNTFDSETPTYQQEIKDFLKFCARKKLIYIQ